MGLRKLKKYKKQFTILTKTYNFSEPIQVLVDANTILEADRINYDLIKSINTHIPHDTHLFISQCCINNLYKSKNENAIAVAKNMQKRFCHHKETLPSKECINSIVNHDGENKYRFVVITQNEKLRDDLRAIPAVPMFFMKKGVLVMEPLSKTTKRIAEYVNTQKLTNGLNDVYAGKRIKEEEEEEEGKDGRSDEPNKKKKKVKGVNPLSMKKKQKKEVKAERQSVSEDQKKRRKRKHKKISENNTDQAEVISDEAKVVSTEENNDINEDVNSNNQSTAELSTDD